MKIHFEKAGAEPIQPDFAMLCASLVGVQAASPTALAEAAAPAPKEPVNPLIERLAWPVGEERDGRWSASFHPVIARREAGDER